MRQVNKMDEDEILRIGGFFLFILTVIMIAAANSSWLKTLLEVATPK